MNNIPRRLFLFYRWAWYIGSIGFILVLDILMVLIFLVDLWRYRASGRRFTFLFQNFFHGVPLSQLLNSFLLGLLLIFALPLFIAGIIIITRKKKLGHSPNLLYARNAIVHVVHILISALLALAVIVGYKIQLSSGISFLNSSRTFALGSYYLACISLFTTPLIAWVTGGAAFITILSLIFSKFTKGVFPNWMILLKDGIRLEYLKDEYYPKYLDRHSLYFRASIWPRIKSVTNTAEKITADYEKRQPGSSESTLFLEQKAKNCTSMISHLFVAKESQNSTLVEVFSSTSRALEVALNKLYPAGAIVLSPYEHESELCVSKQFGHSSIIQLTLDPSAYDLPKEDQIKSIINELCDTIIDHEEKIALILSEVSYETGMRIPIDALVDMLLNELINRDLMNMKPYIIVDGAHCVGNCAKQISLNNIDAYLFSGHKWLASGEPCGILLTKIGDNYEITYDSWGLGVPKCTASVRQIGALYGALEFADIFGIEERAKRSEFLKQIFMKIVKGKLDPVGRDSGFDSTSMIAVRPAPSWKWRLDKPQDMKAFLSQKKIDLDIINKGKQYWLRIAFPYFISDLEARELASFLVSKVEPA